MILSVLDYNCWTAAGENKNDLWKALNEGTSFGQEGVCRWQPPQADTHQGSMVSALLACTEQFQGKLNGRLGVILASTKGAIEDVIWQESFPELDPLSPVLDEFIERARLTVDKSVCVSNACASSHSAFFLGHRWLLRDVVDQVLVIATDAVGPFVEKGFGSLRALTKTVARPFSDDRDGLQLGGAAAAILLGKDVPCEIELEKVAIDVEGYAVTRPSPSGRSLLRACEAVIDDPVDFAIAHGTATKSNDSAEDHVFTEVLGKNTAVSACKGSVGHTLGASGLIDTIAACEVIRNRRLPAIVGTKEIDLDFQARYQIRENLEDDFVRGLVTTLGFGGVHGALVVRRGA